MVTEMLQYSMSAASVVVLAESSVEGSAWGLQTRTRLANSVPGSITRVLELLPDPARQLTRSTV